MDHSVWLEKVYFLVIEEVLLCAEKEPTYRLDHERSHPVLVTVNHVLHMLTP